MTTHVVRVVSHTPDLETQEYPAKDLGDALEIVDEWCQQRVYAVEVYLLDPDGAVVLEPRDIVY